MRGKQQVEGNCGVSPNQKISLVTYGENKTLNCQIFLFKGTDLQLKCSSGNQFMVLHKNSTLFCWKRLWVIIPEWVGNLVPFQLLTIQGKFPCLNVLFVARGSLKRWWNHCSQEKKKRKLADLILTIVNALRWCLTWHYWSNTGKMLYSFLLFHS